MPTYEYVCDSCGHGFEEFQSMKDPALVTCPECATDSLRRVITGGTGVIFRGSGFYVNDSRAGANGSKGKKDAGSESSASDAKTGSSETAGSEAKSGGDATAKTDGGSKKTESAPAKKEPASAGSGKKG